METLDIRYPTCNYRSYIQCIYEFCERNKLSMILKGSLAKGNATKYSDIDLIVLGDIDDERIDEIITLYGKPIMTNFTENPKGILILVYEDSISVDLDLRETISYEDLQDSKILLKYDANFIISKKEIRKRINSNYMPNRDLWYKTLRLLHRATIKYLSNKTDNAYNLLAEIEGNFKVLDIDNIKLEHNFPVDIQSIYRIMSEKFQIDNHITVLFQKIFQEFI